MATTAQPQTHLQPATTTPPDAAGAVVALWRYPVKSMMGEELNAADVTSRGVPGDRAYALVDAADGKVASAKNPRKWGRLFDCRAAYVEPPQPDAPPPRVRLTLPDGAVVHSDDQDIDERLSAVVGRPATLMTTAPKDASFEEYWPDIEGLLHQEKVTDEPLAFAAPGTFFDLAPIHMLTTATIDRLREVYPQGRFEARRFRPNIVVRTPPGDTGFVENEWVGRTVALGEAVRLQIIVACPRCVMTTLPQGDLPSDPGILRAAAQHNRIHIPVVEQEMPSVGVYAVVTVGGVVRRGDTLALL